MFGSHRFVFVLIHSLSGKKLILLGSHLPWLFMERDLFGQRTFTVIDLSHSSCSSWIVHSLLFRFSFIVKTEVSGHLLHEIHWPFNCYLSSPPCTSSICSVWQQVIHCVVKSLFLVLEIIYEFHLHLLHTHDSWNMDDDQNMNTSLTQSHTDHIGILE